MKTILVDEIRTCDLCGKKGEEYYDAPTSSGAWANMCPNCFKEQGSKIGTHFKLRDRENIVKKLGDTGDTIIKGKELSNLADDDREIGCPNCGEVRMVEPDADYIFKCEGCGSKVQVPSWI